jgi:hypothetical protein
VTCRAPYLRCPKPASITGGAGARPDHPINRLPIAARGRHPASWHLKDTLFVGTASWRRRSGFREVRQQRGHGLEALLRGPAADRLKVIRPRMQLHAPALQRPLEAKGSPNWAPQPSSEVLVSRSHSVVQWRAPCDVGNSSAFLAAVFW